MPDKSSDNSVSFAHFDIIQDIEGFSNIRNLTLRAKKAFLKKNPPDAISYGADSFCLVFVISFSLCFGVNVVSNRPNQVEKTCMRLLFYFIGFIVGRRLGAVYLASSLRIFGI